MRILFDDRPGLTCPTGVGRYARSMAALLRALAGHEAESLTALMPECSSASEMELELPALLAREEFDLFHSPLWYLPVVLRCGALVTVHDAIPATHPGFTTEAFRPLWKRAYAEVRRAEGVVCPTEHARERVTEALSLEPERVHVVPEAPAEAFSPRPQEAVDEALAELGVDEPYVLCVGSVEPRKNPDGVLDAIASLPEARRPLALFTGPAGGFYLEAHAARRGLEGRVRALGLVRDELLARLYSGARAVLCCSHAEGFGLPVVEAWACGAPVVASGTTSLAEVAGDAALLVDPKDPAAIAASVARCLESVELREDLRGRGRERLAERYSIDRVREALARVYDELALEVA